MATSTGRTPRLTRQTFFLFATLLVLINGCVSARPQSTPVIRELRDLTRYRKRLVQDHTREGQRVE